MMKKSHLSKITAFSAGLVFSLGLLASGMANPEKVLGFLDLAGAWDPSLALVMAGAIGVGLPVFRLAGARRNQGRGLSFIGETIQLPTKRDIDRPLVIGSLIFGIGWGLAGFCPGPAIVATGAGAIKAIVFTAAMLTGMGIFHLLNKPRPDTSLA